MPREEAQKESICKERGISINKKYSKCLRKCCSRSEYKSEAVSRCSSAALKTALNVSGDIAKSEHLMGMQKNK